MLVIMESNIYGGDNKYKEETFTLYLVIIVIAKILPILGD